MSSENIITITDNSFKTDVLDSDLPVIVDFWAEWCGPCKAIAPVIEELAKEYSGKIKVGKVNVDDNSDTTSKYAIRSIPTLLFFKKGEVVDQIIGAVPKQQIIKKLDKII